MRGLFEFTILWLVIAVSTACRGVEADPSERHETPAAAPDTAASPTCIDDLRVHVRPIAPARTSDSCVWIEPFPTIDFTVRVDENVPLSSFTGTLTQRGGRIAMRYEPSPGHFRFIVSPRDEAMLVLFLKPMRFEIARIARIEGIEPPTPGAMHRQLDPIDLRGRIRSLEARFLDPHHRPLACVLVHIDDGAGHRTMTVTSDEGWISVLVPREVERLPARVSGYRPTSFGSGEAVRLVPE